MPLLHGTAWPLLGCTAIRCKQPLYASNLTTAKSTIHRHNRHELVLFRRLTTHPGIQHCQCHGKLLLPANNGLENGHMPQTI
jgi:hypothetical protein